MSRAFADLLNAMLPIGVSLGCTWMGIKFATMNNHRLLWFLAFIVGAGVAVLSYIPKEQERADHTAEIAEQNRRTGMFAATMKQHAMKSETDLWILQLELDDAEKWNAQLSQYAASVRELARATAEASQRQYQAKVTSDYRLNEMVMDEVRKIRELASQYRMTDQQLMRSMQRESIPVHTALEWAQVRNDYEQKLSQIGNARAIEFRSSILPNSLFLRGEFVKRGISCAALGGKETSIVDIAFQGMLVGPDPELALADCLEQMARQLPGN